VLIEVSAAGRRVPERSNSSARSNKRIGKRTAPMLVQKIVGGSGAKTAAPAPIRGGPRGVECPLPELGGPPEGPAGDRPWPSRLRPRLGRLCLRSRLTRSSDIGTAALSFLGTITGKLSSSAAALKLSVACEVPFDCAG
jgi:hypothetical protein